MIVAGPTCGGMSTRMPSIGSRPVSTSQNISFVLTPSPSGLGHIIIAGSVWSGGGGGGGLDGARRAGGRVVRVCAFKTLVRLKPDPTNGLKPDPAIMTATMSSSVSR